MKKNITAIALGLTIILNAILITYVVSSNKRAVNFQSSLSRQISQLQSELSGLEYNISSTLETQASMIERIDWAYGEVDIDSLTVHLKTTIVPKDVGSDDTASLTVNGTSVPMARDGVQFSAEIPVALFDPIDAYVTFQSETAQRTQNLDIFGRPFEKHLLGLEASNNGGSTFEHLTGKYTLDGPIHIDLSVPEGNALTSLKIISTQNGSIIKEQDLGTAIPDHLIDYKLETKLSTNQTYDTAVVATDTYGLTYRALVDQIITGSDLNESVDFGMGFWDSVTILDKNGNVLYDSTKQYQ